MCTATTRLSVLFCVLFSTAAHPATKAPTDVVTGLPQRSCPAAKTVYREVSPIAVSAVPVSTSPPSVDPVPALLTSLAADFPPVFSRIGKPTHIPNLPSELASVIYNVPTLADVPDKYKSGAEKTEQSIELFFDTYHPSVKDATPMGLCSDEARELLYFIVTGCRRFGLPVRNILTCGIDLPLGTILIYLILSLSQQGLGGRAEGKNPLDILDLFLGWVATSRTIADPTKKDFYFKGASELTYFLMREYCYLRFDDCDLTQRGMKTVVDRFLI